MRSNASDNFPGTAWFLASFIVTLAFLSAPCASHAQTAGRPVRPLRVAYLSTSATMTPVWMAKETGAFVKEGLDVEVLSLASSSFIPALLANEIDVVGVSAAPIITVSSRAIGVVVGVGLLDAMLW